MSQLELLESALKKQTGKIYMYKRLVLERHGSLASYDQKMDVAREVLGHPDLGVLGGQTEFARYRSMIKA